MPISAPIVSHFDGGEVSPLFYGRVDAERYKSSLALCQNWIATLQGGLIRRPGSQFVANCPNNGQWFMIPFQFSTTQSYILLFGPGEIGFYSNYSTVLKSGTPYFIGHPYTAQDIPNIRFTQDADVLYLVHPYYQPRKLQRFGPTDWVLVPCTFLDGPYLPVNTGNITMTPNVVGVSSTITVGPVYSITGCANNGAGLIRVTTSAAYLWTTGQWVYISGVTGTLEANGAYRIIAIDSTHFDLQSSTFTNAYVSGGGVGPAGSMAPTTDLFTSGIVGSPLRLLTGATWGWGIIVNVILPTTGGGIQIQVSTKVNFGGTTATNSWAIGLWQLISPETGFPNFPSTVNFHENRLCFSGTPSDPQRIDGSRTADYENFAPSQLDGTVHDSDAFSFYLNANEVNAMAWLSSDEKGLLAGSVGAEWSIRPNLTSEAITPTNVSAKRSTKWGSAIFSPVQVGKATIYIQRGARKLRELTYDFYVDGYRSTELSELAEHITGSGVIAMCYQSIPISVIWLLRNDGVLLGCTYDRDINQLRVGWHKHVLGGVSDGSGNPPIIESIAVIPSPDGVRDDLWMVVQRRVNGQTVRYIEYLSKIFEDIDNPVFAPFLDCGNTFDVPLPVIVVTTSNPVRVNVSAHGLATGDSIRIDSVVGVDSSGVSLLNGNKFLVTVIDSSHFSLRDLSGNPINGSLQNPYKSGGIVRKLVSTISGLTYLANETVSVLADGAVQGPFVVSNAGLITLDQPAGTLTVGYPYNSDGQLLRLESGSRNGTSMGKIRRTHKVGVMVHRSQGLSLGPNFSNMDPVQFRTQGNNSGSPEPLFSGIVTQTLDFNYDMENQLCFRAGTPLPCTITAIMPQLETQDEG